MTRDSMPSEGRSPSSLGVVAGAEGLPPDPGPDDPRAHVAWQLAVQGVVCTRMGSPLYGALLEGAAADVATGGPTWEVLAGEVAPGRGDALALRFMAALHRLVLLRRAPALALHYPSVGGRPGADAPAVLLATVAEHAAALVDLVRLPCQTNEVGRAAALVGGFLAVAARTGLPLRVLEVGASAGLNLRWDRFRYGGGGASWGPPDSPVDLSGHWAVPPPDTGTAAVVVERRGCDRAPVDPTTPEGRLALTAAVWADQTDRLARLRGALAVAAEVPAVVDRAPLESWTAAQLADRSPGVATVVCHSIVEEYLDAGSRAAFHAALAAAGARATVDAPLAWLRLEPLSALRSHGLALTTWPGGAEEVLATCGAHGTAVTWRDGTAPPDRALRG